MSAKSVRLRESMRANLSLQNCDNFIFGAATDARPPQSILHDTNDIKQGARGQRACEMERSKAEVVKKEKKR